MTQNSSAHSDPGAEATRHVEPLASPLRRRWGLFTLRVRLLLLVLLAVLPAITVIVDTGLAQRRQAAREAQDDARRLARLAASDHARVIEEGRQLLSALAEIPSVRDATPGACQGFLGRLAARSERFANFGVIRPDGEVVCTGVPRGKTINVGDRSYFRRAIRSHAFAVGDYQIGRFTNLPVLVLAAPTYDASSRLRSVVFAALHLAWLNRFAAQANLPPGSSMVVMDQAGTVLARTPDSKKWVGKPAPEASLLDRAAPDRDGVTQAPGPDGRAYLYALADLEGLPRGSRIHVVVGVPAETAYGPSDRLLARNLSVLGAVLVLVLLVAWAGAEVLVLRRANALAAAAQRLAAGDLSARTGVAFGRDELSAVAETFDRMAEALGERAREAGEHIRRIARLNRVYAILSDINGAILRIRDRDALLKEVCRIAVEDGGFQFAWAGLIDPADNAVRPSAWAGEPRGCIEGAAASLDAAALAGCGPVATALREGRHVLRTDSGHGLDRASSGEAAPAHAPAVSAAFPLRIEGRVVGVLKLYADEPGFFTDDELRLLDELAADTSLGLEHIDQARRLNYLAYHDALTDLPNINLFLDRLAQVLARARHHQRVLAVLIFEIQGFRETVGTVGRQAGDRMLRAAGEYLAGAVREGDTVARLEGDEFGVALADIARLEDAVQVAEKLAREFPPALRVGDEEIVLRVRVGVSIYPSDGEDPETLLKHARLAARSAVASGQSPVAFYARGLNEAIQEERRIERALRHALEREELELHYQPVVELATLRVAGLEALARWMSPELGPVPPTTFIPIAEVTGLILPLGDWVLRRAVQQRELWREQGLSIGRIAVNVSARQLRDPGFAARVRAILEETGTDPSREALAIEVTESELMDDVDAAVSLLRELKGLGLAVYVDDFGTGYSSLGYLQKLPLDTLKIDQRFVRDLETAPENVAIVRAIVALARALNLRVIAEGVETEGQLAILREAGVDAAQGFLLGRPVPPEDLSPILERGVVSPAVRGE